MEEFKAATCLYEVEIYSFDMYWISQNGNKICRAPVAQAFFTARKSQEAL